MARQVIIESAINGVASKQRNPHIAVTPAEIADDALATAEAGAAIIHFHVRDPDTGEWSHDVDLYADVYRRVREHSDVLMWPTFATGPDPELRYRHIVELARDPVTRPAFALVDPGSANLVAYDPSTRELRGEKGVYRNSYATNRYFLETARDLGLRPTLQIFDASFLRAVLIFLEQGLLIEPLTIKFYFGGPELPFGLPPRIESLHAYLAMLEGVRAEWFAASIGGDIFPLLPAAVALGGHIRIGLEDHHYQDEGQPSNPELVERARTIVDAMGHQVASIATTRAALAVD